MKIALDPNYNKYVIDNKIASDSVTKLICDIEQNACDLLQIADIALRSNEQKEYWVHVQLSKSAYEFAVQLRETFNIDTKSDLK